MPTTEPSYLLTKVTVPPLRGHLISRSRLLERLSARVPLTLLAAGAGYGKTTLLSTWANAQHGMVAWLTLEEAENDPLRFWGYVRLALRMCVPLLEESGGADVASFPPTDITALPGMLTALLNELADGDEELTLILDDYHVIEEPSIHQSLGFLLEHAPACLRLCLSTRTDPPLLLARLRAHGQLCEIREADLRVSAHEAATFLAQTMDLALPEEEVRALTQRTEGWITGLQLAALAMRAHPDPQAVVHAHVSSHRHLLDYVQEEILASVPETWRAFLLHTAILPRLSAPLCRMVTGEETTAEMLEAMVRANLFVAPQDAEWQWYRVHPLIREVLCMIIQRREPDLVPRLHLRAAHWFAEQNLLHEAIAHALSAGDGELAADLIARLVVPHSWRNEYHSLRDWLSRLPNALLRSHPDLSLLYAVALFLTTQVGASPFPQMLALLEDSEQGYRAASSLSGVGSVLATRAIFTSFQGDFLTAFALTHESLALLPENDVQWRGQILSLVGLEALTGGELKAVHTFLQQARACFEAAGQLGSRQFVTVMEAEVRLLQGDRKSAKEGMRAVLGLADAEPTLARLQLTDVQGNRRAHLERVASYSLAGLFYEENRLEEAEAALALALSEGQFPWLHVLSGGRLLQVRLLCARGQDDRAQALLETWRAQTHLPSVLREIACCQAFLAMLRGDLAQVSAWAAELSTQGPPLSCAREIEEGVLLARLHLARGEPAEAQQEILPRLKAAQAQGREHHVLALQVVLALAETAAGNHTQARKRLREAVSKAAPRGYVRLLLEEGEAMERLLQQLVPDLPEKAESAYVHTLLQAFARAQRSPEGGAELAGGSVETGSVSLTSQEQRVLQLLAQGASNQEIARALVIERSTARKHVSNLLGKLGAKNRTQAITRAQKWGLLSPRN